MVTEAKKPPDLLEAQEAGAEVPPRPQNSESEA